MFEVQSVKPKMGRPVKCSVQGLADFLGVTMTSPETTCAELYEMYVKSIIYNRLK